VTARVREARRGEVDELLALYEWLFAPPGSVPPGWDPERASTALGEAIDSEQAAVLVAEEDGRLVGLCTAYLELNSVRFGLRCWVEDLAVAPERRSRGIGAGLLETARRWAAGQGATHLELDTGEARTDARRFYERLEPAWRSISYAWLLDPESG
jgi:GNAT superfamily N-acetyltransferase